MMKSLITLALLLIFFVLPASADGKLDLNPQARLRKLSMHVRGIPASLADHQALANAIKNGGNIELFFQSKTKEYLATPQHAAKMMTRLDELFRLKISSAPPEKFFTHKETPKDSFSVTDQQYVNNATEFLFRALAQQNLSWDTLLNGKQYVASFARVTGPSDVGFYKDIYPSLPRTSNGVIGIAPQKNDDEDRDKPSIKIEFEANDSRIAGALTTPRFTNRYNNTNLNQNRRRAAAVFRIFLCDDMKPIVLPSAAENDILLEKALTDEIEQDQQSRANKKKAGHPRIMREKHGTDPVCMSCHFKLDPLGKAFMAIDNVITSAPSPGALVFKRTDGTLVNIPGTGLGHVAKSITEQPEYARCQVGHFWNWYIGTDVFLSDERREQLVAKFNDVDRRTNDFINYLVNEPEFYKGTASQGFVKESLVDRHRSASRHLNMCMSCHNGVGVEAFNKFPIGGSAKSHKEMILTIIERLDLAGDGSQSDMPPQNSGWNKKETQDAADAIRKWICDSAPDQNGMPTIAPTDIPEEVCGK